MAPTRAPGEPAGDALRRLVGAAPPGPELDRYLDALTACVARSGLRRLSVQDVARELGVDRTTVYRQAGTIKAQLRLLAARDVGRLLSSPSIRHLVQGDPAAGAGLPDTIVAAIDRSVELARAHPVVARVIDDDAEMVTLRSLADLGEILAGAAEVLAPRLQAAMEAGWIEPRDPAVLAGWIVHVTAWMVLMPPPGDQRAVLRESIRPLLVRGPADAGAPSVAP